MIKSGFARLLLTCTMPNKTPTLIRPIIMKYAERKTTTTWTRSARTIETASFAAIALSTEYFAFIVSSLLVSNRERTYFFIRYDLIISKPDNRSFTWFVKEDSISEYLSCRLESSPPNRLGTISIMAIAIITHTVTIMSK